MKRPLELVAQVASVAIRAVEKELDEKGGGGRGHVETLAEKTVIDAGPEGPDPPPALQELSDSSSPVRTPFITRFMPLRGRASMKSIWVGTL